MSALLEAQELWDHPSDLISLWANDENKMRIEQLIADKLGFVNSLADLGCGIGRYADKVSCSLYYGFDASVEMIRRAKDLHPGKEFSSVDIFNFSSDRIYDAVISIDVVIHQEDPVQGVLDILSNWKADRYLISILVAPDFKQLLNSTVVSFEDFYCIMNVAKKLDIYVEQIDDFSWFLLDIKDEA